MHCLGSITSLRPKLGRYRSSWRVMNALRSVVSVLDIACISAWVAKLAARVLTLTEASKMRRNETPGVSQAALKAAREKAGKTTSEVAQYLGLALEDYVAIE